MKLFSLFFSHSFVQQQSMIEVKVTFIDDDVFEPTESFNPTLSHSLAVRDVQINPITAEVSIIDKDSKSYYYSIW